MYLSFFHEKNKNPARLHLCRSISSHKVGIPVWTFSNRGHMALTLRLSTALLRNGVGTREARAVGPARVKVAQTVNAFL